MADCLVRGQKGPGPDNFVCSSYVSGVFKTPEEGHSLSPWVKAQFVSPKGEKLGYITVSNQSSPSTTPPHVAGIKSFEFGYADGLSVRMVIQDQEGGSFYQFMVNTIKNYACLDKTAASVELKFSFGWTKSGCSTEFNSSSSPCYYAIMDSIETSFSDGIFTFEITGKDKGFKMLEGGDSRVFGGDGDKAVPIKEAITKLLTEGPHPIIASVKFMTWDNGVKRTAKFLKGDRKGNKENGPEGKYECKNRDKLQTVIEWLKEIPSEHSRGWIPGYNSLVENGELIIWEDRKDCGDQADNIWDKSSIGTYIVNGSKYSPVIEFAPKIRWDFSRLSNGGTVGVENPNGMKNDADGGGKNPGDPCASIGRTKNPGAGQMTTTYASENATNNEAKGEVEKAVAKANAVARKAMKLITDPITADMTIIGDPEIMPPSDGLYQKNCSVILINPYFIMPTGSCGEWLAQPVCNQILSNKAWEIASVTHRIESGKFTTTLGLFLSAPGEDIDLTSKLGGWSGGWAPPNNCG